MGKLIPLRPVTKKLGDGRNPTAHQALEMVRTLAQDSKCVWVVGHAREKQKKREISRRQIMTCLKKGRITEGPFINIHGNWQVNITGRAAGESVTCVTAIEWDRRLIVVTVF